MLGRWFNKRRQPAPNGPANVILDYGYWQRRFNSDRNVIGRSIVVDGKSRTIIGVMPRSFHFLDWKQPAIILAHPARSRQDHARPVQL